MSRNVLFRASLVCIVLGLPVHGGLAMSVSGDPSDGSYTISWSSGDTYEYYYWNETRWDIYELQERVDGGSWTTLEEWGTSSVAFSGKADGTYEYKLVWYYYGCEASAAEVYDPYVYNGVAEEITVEVGAPAAPDTPTGPTTTQYDGAYTISWNTVSGAATYGLQERLSGGTWSTLQNTSATSRSITGKTPGTWEYQVRAENAGGNSAYSGTKSVTVATPPPVPGAIAGPTRDGDGAYTLSWGSSTGATSYELEKRFNSGSWSNEYTGTATTDSVSGQAKSTYRYRVKACNSAGCSAWTATHTVVVLFDVTANGDQSGLLGYEEPRSTIPGSMPGGYSVSRHGTFVYEIPIEVPPGSAGVEPNLSLRYDSNAGNGVLGVGWALRRLSAVTRCKATEANDGFSGGIGFDSNDRFCLDGQRLIDVSGTYGANATEYRTEVDGIRKVISHGTAGNGPQYFTARDKNGDVAEYGNTTNSRIEAVGKSDVLIWAIGKGRDSSGNYMVYTYTEDTTNGDYRLDKIDYTGHPGDSNTPAVSTYASVQFTYETRTDLVPAYYDGSQHEMQKRLTNIKTYVGTALVRDYRIAALPHVKCSLGLRRCLI